ncbi:uncharacterized protein BX664DRAFT_290001 [Halteromyces radiatus]|uniref:uncharacterized protein n=1 Tax=Halteromyces radiatus TaxID=101107 RepID=UPI0022201FF5|nr:uncharacterized protein BX664DRAFT_290001 [Halteromyces radiatus]KAI8099730.1 hypothetical protein BX664DRAFT_290001 [Halteromyces radiatus]
MKSTLSYLSLILALAVTLLAAVVRADGHYKGVATMMKFESSSDVTMNKRAFRGTWYSGNDLKNAACYGRNGLPSYSATIHSMIGAMAMNGFENCYKCMKIVNNQQKHLSVVVKIVDKCAGCKVNQAIDLTPNAFAKLAPGGDLGIGVLDISWKPVRCPNSKLYPSKPKA